jgi:hypothetical protein
MIDKIIELLSNGELRETLVKTIQDVYRYAEGFYIDQDMQGLPRDWTGAWFDAEVHGHANRIGEAFDKYVFSKMQGPLVVHPEEILDEFYDLMCSGGTGCLEMVDVDFDNLYRVFVARVKTNLSAWRRSGDFQICRLSDAEPGYYDGLGKGMIAGLQGPEEAMRTLQEALAENESPSDVLWEHGDLKICLSREDGYLMTANARGHMSKKTLASIESSLPEVLQAGIRSLALLYGEKPDRYPRGLPEIQEAVLYGNRDVLTVFLDFFFTQSDKTGKQKKEKDSLDRRIRNAVLLLIESHTQRNDAIGLALSVSAIEALLGEKGSDISEKLSTNVAVLLEPDLEKRHAATKFVKEIYDMRSRALHGEQVDGEASFRLQALHLASAILLAVISRRNFLKRSGLDAENPQGLLRGLRESRFGKGQPVGVDEYNVREYWSTYKDRS